MITSDINGLILNGGKSQRMGFDKGLISFHNKPQSEYLYELLGSMCRQVFMSYKAEDPIVNLQNYIVDKFALDSPLNGILSAFEFDPDHAWLTVPIDMPFITREIIDLLVAERDKECDATCFTDADGILPEPLVTIWEPLAFPKLKQFQSAGKKSPRDFLISNRVKLLKAPHHNFHLNVNTPEELEKFKNQKRYSS
jgi:molybdopterin-guanine dinucleotide biosynthesis protein A